MKIVFSDNAKRQYKRLPLTIKSKAERKLPLLEENYRHPSLRTRKMLGTEVYEGRIDIHYRFTFSVEGDSLLILTTGMHDTGLGKK